MENQNSEKIIKIYEQKQIFKIREQNFFFIIGKKIKKK
jgi:hypothetical protein